MGLPLLPAGPDPAISPADAGVPDLPLWGELSVRIERPFGEPIEWTGDELDAARVPCDLAFTSAAIGGFKNCTCVLFRAMGLTGQEGMFDEVFVLGPGQEIVWQGRLQQMPASSSSGGKVSPLAVGWSAHLEDDQTVMVLGTDRELSGWGPVPAGRRFAINGASFAVIDGSVRWDDNATGSAGPVVDLRRPKGMPRWDSNSGRPHVTISYNCAGVPLSGVSFRVRRPVDIAGWSLQIVAFSDLACSTVTGSPATWAGASLTEGTLVSWSCPADTRAVEIALIYPGAPAGNADNEYGLMLAEVAVYGDISGGVATPSYTGATNGPLGYRVSDVLPQLLRRAAPLLRWSTETISSTDFLVRHFVGREPGALAALIEQLNRYHLWDFGVWERREFAFRPRWSGRTWRVATDDGLDLDLEGDSADQVWTGIVVTYTDYAGFTHTVGPPGSGAERTDPRLAATDPNNPATAHGFQRWHHEPMSVPADHEVACTFGQAWLVNQADATRRGSATVRGTIRDQAGNAHPTWRVRGGDTLIIDDREDDPPRRIVETAYAHRDRSIAMTLDNSAATADAMFERVAAALVGVI